MFEFGYIWINLGTFTIQQTTIDIWSKYIRYNMIYIYYASVTSHNQL